MKFHITWVYQNKIISLFLLFIAVKEKYSSYHLPSLSAQAECQRLRAISPVSSPDLIGPATSEVVSLLFVVNFPHPDLRNQQLRRELARVCDCLLCVEEGSGKGQTHVSRVFSTG